jgi:hypothetical protein
MGDIHCIILQERYLHVIRVVRTTVFYKRNHHVHYVKTVPAGCCTLLGGANACTGRLLCVTTYKS